MIFRFAISCGVFLCLSALSLSAELYMSPRYMAWEEFYQGSKLLRENGWILGLGLKHEGRYVQMGAEIYGGRLNYDGQTQAGDPVRTKTDYAGLQAYLGPRIDITDFLRVGLLYNLELWRRNIRSTSYAIGYSEDWFYHSIDPKVSIKALNLYIYSLYRFVLGARMQANIYGVPQLEPRRSTAYEVGAGFRKGRMSLEFYYSYLRFRQSEPKRAGTSYVLQPTSVRELYGFRFGIGF